MTAEDLDPYAIADRIAQGDDPYEVPPELLEEPPPPAPATQSLFAQIHGMTIAQRIKLALRGNRDARMILIRDANKLIQKFVLQNPRISDEEIVAIARNRNIESDLLKTIGDHKYWPRNYQVRLALVTNPKTPLATALHYLQGLAERDLRFLGKSKHVSATIVAQARRLVAQRESGR